MKKLSLEEKLLLMIYLTGGDLLVIDDGEVPLRQLDDLSDLVDISEEETPLRILVATPEGEVLRELA